jgi:hypothetical protein
VGTGGRREASDYESRKLTMTNFERLDEFPKALLASVLELLAERKVNHPGAALTLSPDDLASSCRLHCLILRRSQMLGKKLRAHTGMNKRWAISSTVDFSWNSRTTRFVSRISRPCCDLGVTTKSLEKSQDPWIGVSGDLLTTS